MSLFDDNVFVSVVIPDTFNLFRFVFVPTFKLPEILRFLPCIKFPVVMMSLFDDNVFVNSVIPETFNLLRVVFVPTFKLPEILILFPILTLFTARVPLSNNPPSPSSIDIILFILLKRFWEVLNIFLI